MFKLVGKLILGVAAIIGIVAFVSHFSPKVDHQPKYDHYVITTLNEKGLIEETHMVDAIYGVKDGVMRYRSIEDGNMREVKFNRLILENINDYEN